MPKGESPPAATIPMTSGPTPPSIAASSWGADETPASIPADRSSQFTWDHGGIIRGDPSRRELAIVFTADEFGEGTSHVLNVLAARHAPGSFFLTGNYLRDPRFRPFVKQMLADGHYVGPHSNAHPLYCSWEDRKKTLITREQFREDLEANIRELESLDWNRPKPWLYFIPPYEWFNEDQVQWAGEMGVRIFNLTPGIGTNRDYIPESQPTFKPSRQLLNDALLFESRKPAGLNGAIMLVHLGAQREDKLYLLLDSLIDQLQTRGYRFMRIDELLKSAS